MWIKVTQGNGSNDLLVNLLNVDIVTNRNLGDKCELRKGDRVLCGIDQSINDIEELLRAIGKHGQHLKDNAATYGNNWRNAKDMGALSTGD